MKVNFKLCLFCCAIAFALSFLTALISGAGFGIAFLRALIIGVCFGALSVGISFLYDKFLKDESSDGLSSGNSSTSASQIGNKVDITIDDEELPEEPNSPRFVLTGQNQMLNNDDLKNASVDVSNFNQEQSKSQNILSDDSKKIEAVKTENSAAQIYSNSSAALENSEQTFKPISLGNSSADETDELPSIENSLGDGSFLKDGKSEDGESEEDNEDAVDVLPDSEGSFKNMDNTVTDSEFATGGKNTSRLSETIFPDGSKAESKDATLMAEAIRTVLQKSE